MSTNFAVNYTSSKLAVAAALAGASYIAWRIYSVQKVQLPTEWREVGTLEELLAYPIKSCRWVELQQAECTSLGLRVDWLRDRTLMVIDKNDNFVSARSYPEMLRVEVTFKGALMTLSHPDMEPLVVDLSDTVRSPRFEAKVWSTPVQVHNCGGEPSEWFSRLLHKQADTLRLVYYPSDRCRPLRASTNPVFRFRDQDTGALPDETSFNLMNRASVSDLAARVKLDTVSPRQFRPNFVVTGPRPLEEDAWKFVRIGENVFEVIKPCTRCVMTTIDPLTAVKNANGEPLKTLKGYRQLSEPVMRRAAGSSPRLGLQLALRSAPGRVAVGDAVSVAC